MRNFKKFIMFCLVGLGATLMDWLFFNIIYYLFPWFIFSRICSGIISMIFNFNMNRNFTFSARSGSARKQLIKWIIVYTISIGANTLVGKLVLNIIGGGLLNVNIAYFAGLAVSIPLGFIGSLLWTFKKE